MTCPESQGVLVADTGAGLSLESAHTKTVFGLWEQSFLDTVLTVTLILEAGG